MKRVILIISIIVMSCMLTTPAFCTNGLNVIGVGPTSRAMGGVGVAAPQDAASAIFSNPAALNFVPCAPGSEAVYGLTFFDATVQGKIDLTGMGLGVAREESKARASIIPAIGITSPITDERFEKFRFGIGAFGVSGFNVDYKESSFLEDISLQIQVMKFSPSIAYMMQPGFSIGASLHIDYGSVDFGNGIVPNYTIGGQVGILYEEGKFRFGASYTTPQKIEHKRVADLDGDTSLDTLDVESPTCYAFGIAIKPTDDLLIETDAKWYNWADVAGYEDFGFKNQWVFAVGIQYEPSSKVALRAGFNSGENPVDTHNGFDPMGATNVQGKNVPNMSYETLRIIGIPAVVEKHLTLGIGYDISESVIINLSYLHAFEETIKERSAMGMMALESTVKGDSGSVAISWMF